MIWQENYINCRPSSVGKDDNGIKCMSLIARAAESIGDGDIINVQIRRYRLWQLSQINSLASCIIPYVFSSCHYKIQYLVYVLQLNWCLIFLSIFKIFVIISAALLHEQMETRKQVRNCLLYESCMRVSVFCHLGIQCNMRGTT